jgi:hypothetical protein
MNCNGSSLVCFYFLVSVVDIILYSNMTFFYHGSSALVGLDLLIVEVSRSHSDTHTLGRTSLDEGSARRRNLYLTTHNKIKRQRDSVPPVGFEPAIPAI